MTVAPLIGDLDQIIAGIGKATSNATPLERLAVAHTAAVRLQTLAQHVTGHFVDDARESGASWTEIGNALGVTRQAAQQRFVPAPSADIESVLNAVPLPLSTRARTAIDTARALAVEKNHRTVDDLHLLIALLDSRNSGALNLVKSTGRRPAELRKAARVHLAADGTRRTSKTPPLARSAIRAVQLATRNALRSGEETIGTEHLLTALAAEKDSAAGQALADAGIHLTKS